MRKTFLILSILSLSNLVLAEKNVIEVKGGYDLLSRTKFKDVDTDNDDNAKKFVKRGFHLGVEYRREVIENFQVGAGFDFRLSKINEPSEEIGQERIDSYDFGNLISVPLYLTGRYNFKNSTEVTPYVKANLGYAINKGELKGSGKNIYTGELLDTYKDKIKNGMYYGIGTGIEYKNFLVDLSYDITYFKTKTTVNNYEDTQFGEINSPKFNTQKLTLSVGYQFNF